MAARGIDIPEVSLVLQWEFPDDPQSYVHRSGRTGRAGREGVCCIMFNHHERQQLAELEKETGRIPHPTLSVHALFPESCLSR